MSDNYPEEIVFNGTALDALQGGGYRSLVSGLKTGWHVLTVRDGVVVGCRNVADHGEPVVED
jgi:hypothetical protein